MNEDWLALPGAEQSLPEKEQPAEEKNPDSYGWEHADVLRANARDIVEEVKSNLPMVVSAIAVPELPVDGGRRAALLDKAWKELTRTQKVFLTLLIENKFNERATMRLMDLTEDRLPRSTLQSWKVRDEDFAFALKVLKTGAATSSIDRERLLLRAEEIAESALEPTPILYQGRPTGFYENTKDTALRANEQLMKAAGMLKGDEKSQRVVVRVVNLAGPEDDAQKQVIDVAAEVVDE